MFTDDDYQQRHKKHKISADAYAARSNELFECNLGTDDSRPSAHDGQLSREHTDSSKHNRSLWHHHHSSSRDKREEKKQVEFDWFCCLSTQCILLYSDWLTCQLIKLYSVFSSLQIVNLSTQTVMHYDFIYVANEVS